MDAVWITRVTIFLFRFCLRGFKPWFLKQSLWRCCQNTMTNQRLFQYIIFIHKFINCSLKKKTCHLTGCLIQLKSNILLYLSNIPLKLWINQLYINNCKKMITDSLESQELLKIKSSIYIHSYCISMFSLPAKVWFIKVQNYTEFGKILQVRQDRSFSSSRQKSDIKFLTDHESYKRHKYEVGIEKLWYLDSSRYVKSYINFKMSISAIC